MSALDNVQDVMSNIKNTIKYWWVMLLIGILFLVGAFYIFSTPEESYISLSIFFAFVILFDGIGSIFFSISNKDVIQGWGWQLAAGVISSIIGVALLANPAMSMVMLPIFVGFWIIIKGAFIMGASFDLKDLGTDGWGWVTFLGVMTIILGLIMILNLGFGAAMILSFTAISFIVMGLGLIFISLKLKNVKKKVTDFKNASPQERVQQLKSQVESIINDKNVDKEEAFKQIKSKLDQALNDN